MNPPRNSRTLNTPTSYCWFDEHNLLHIAVKSVPEIPLEQRRKILENFKAFAGEKKRPVLIDLNNGHAISKEVRKYTAEKIPQLFSAVAFVASSPFTNMLVRIYLGMRVPDSFSWKTFACEKEAISWLKEQN